MKLIPRFRGTRKSNVSEMACPAGFLFLLLWIMQKMNATELKDKYMRSLITFLYIFALTFPAHADYQEAAYYNATASGIAMVVIKDGKVVFENYVNGGHEKKTVELYSGTKSFSGVIAAAAVQDDIITLDEKASKTLTEWQNDPKKKNITIRQILSLTSGIDTTRPGNYPTYKDAINLPMDTYPGAAFKYGPANFQIFGEIMQRKLKNYKGGIIENPDFLLTKKGVRSNRCES